MQFYNSLSCSCEAWATLIHLLHSGGGSCLDHGGPLPDDSSSFFTCSQIASNIQIGKGHTTPCYDAAAMNLFVVLRAAFRTAIGSTHSTGVGCRNNQDHRCDHDDNGRGGSRCGQGDAGPSSGGSGSRPPSPGNRGSNRKREGDGFSGSSAGKPRNRPRSDTKGTCRLPDDSGQPLGI